MTRIGLAAIGAAMALSACTPPDVTSRFDTYDVLNSGFENADSYTPRPIGARAENDLMRFSTMSLVR